VEMNSNSGDSGHEIAKRRVMHLTSVHPPFDTRIFHKECKSIARAGYDVTLIAGHDRDETVDGIRLKGIARPATRIARMLRSPWAVWRKAMRDSAELFHFHDPELILIGVLLRLKGKIVVYDVHEDLSIDVAFKDYIPALLRRPIGWFVSAIEKVSARCFSALVSATPAIKRRFPFRNGRCVVVSNYPSTDDTAGVSPRPWHSRDASVAYVGIVSPDRGIGEIVKAMSCLPGKMGVTFKLAGPFSPPEFSKELRAMPGFDRVRTFGVISRPEVGQLLNSVRAGLLVCHADPVHVEAVPNKLFEYMQAGIPVIASDLLGFRQVVKSVGCGILVNPGEPKEIASAIEYVFKNPEEAERMGQRGREAVNAEFNWASQERKLLELYAELFDSQATA
jgi:glycosyltransferase involved in cell wall biosynthesis